MALSYPQIYPHNALVGHRRSWINREHCSIPSPEKWGLDRLIGINKDKKMVPQKGTDSNKFLGHGDDLSKEKIEKFTQELTPEMCDALFQTLADWNEILEHETSGLEGLDL